MYLPFDLAISLGISLAVYLKDTLAKIQEDICRRLFVTVLFINAQKKSYQ